MLMQEMASRGVSMLYGLGSDAQRGKLVESLVAVLQVGCTFVEYVHMFVACGSHLRTSGSKDTCIATMALYIRLYTILQPT
jgi:hypothetical protein